MFTTTALEKGAQPGMYYRHPTKVGSYALRLNYIVVFFYRGQYDGYRAFRSGACAMYWLHNDGWQLQ